MPLLLRPVCPGPCVGSFVSPVVDYVLLCGHANWQAIPHLAIRSCWFLALFLWVWYLVHHSISLVSFILDYSRLIYFHLGFRVNRLALFSLLCRVFVVFSPLSVADIYPLPVLQCSRAPVLQCSSAPVLQCSSAPALQRSSAPVLQCSSAPVLQCSSAPALQCSSAPVLQVLQCSSAPVLQCGAHHCI